MPRATKNNLQSQHDETLLLVHWYAETSINTLTHVSYAFNFFQTRVYTQPVHLEIPQVPFPMCPMDCIAPLPASSKGHRFALTFICLLMSYLVTVPLKSKSTDEVSMAYMKDILPNTSCLKLVLQDNGKRMNN